tara:strand:- start:14774 stop:16819 length:2046 start_codon:yes stop_codon:yes gene_type:complete
MKLNDDDLISILDQLESDADSLNDTLEQKNAEVMRREKGELYGNEVAGRSRFVSNDVADLIESDMPGLVRTLLGSGEVIKFVPNDTSNPADVEEAEQKTRYIDWLIRGQEDSFKTHYDFIKDLVRLTHATFKYIYEETQSVEEHSFKSVTYEEMAEIIDSFEKPSVKEVKDIEVTETDVEGELDVTFKVVTETKKVTVCAIQPGNLRISKGATSVKDAALIGDYEIVTRSDLVEMGFKKDLVAKIPTYGQGNEQSSTQTVRQGEEAETESFYSAEWASEKVLYKDLYVKVDQDGDGIAERRRIQRGGNIVLDNEIFPHEPYAIGSAIPEPHKAIGRGRASEVLAFAEVNTALTRNTLDNCYRNNNIKLAVSDKVNKADLLSKSLAGHVRLKKDAEQGGGVANHVMPIEVPFVGDKTLLIIQHMDKLKSQRVGQQAASQGLNADQLNKETATRFEGVRDAAAEKLELVVRCAVEIAYRKLYTGVAWMVSRCHNSEVEFTFQGKPLKTNPGKWKYDHHLSIEVGLGSGDNDKTVETLMGLFQIQTQLLAEQSPVVDQEKRYNTLSKLIKALEMRETGLYFNNPTVPAETLKANNEQLTQMVTVLQQELQSMQNPLAEAETIKAQKDLIKAQGDQDFKRLQLAENARQFDEKHALDIAKQLENISLRLTELEVNSGQNIPGSKV